MIRLALIALLIPVIALMNACSNGEAKYPTGADRTATGANSIYDKAPSIFGDGGMEIFGGKKSSSGPGENGVAVNSYLWRAALDTVSFMPLASADPFGGTIITDWYSDPATPNERTKLNVFILDRQLKAEAISVKVFRQVKSGGSWKDATVAADTGRKMEDAILSRAREMRLTQEQ
ncbi:MAG: DUF3576 domain-containing protein [Alphaproteobacteria bacterium]|jgi:hypothetical protein|nr:DUF3576 domain-containing protein [Alphaproteobacteria bacterium]MCB1550880.1 DUF3576 domain-containing protein [Alphaproteobacteria bacterium]MCB9985611.1 DUF3576 domain-containing protein [Micavibrio sp.]HRK98760.1 DUF3576 domain-containing protein [Alphaproteobacteria bacterium]